MERLGPKDESRGIEKTVLGLFALYTIFAFAAVKLIGIDSYNVMIAACAWFVSCIIYIIKYKNYKIRAIITSTLMQIGVTFFALGLDSIGSSVPLLFVSMVVLQLYGIPEVMYIVLASFVIISGYHASILHTVSLNTADEVLKFVILVANVLISIAMIFLLLKKRQASTTGIKQIITELKTAEKSKDIFLANVSHEIRTPINTICGMSEIALREDDSEKIREELFSIRSAGRNLMSIVSDMLDFSELQRENVVLEEEDYNITSTVNDIINTVMARKKDKPIELIVDCNSNLPCLLRGDEKKIRRVVMNIVNNALKFTSDGCIVIGFSFRRESYGINLIVNVKDTGIGIDEDSIETLFEGFSQADVRADRQNTGLGLGLAISNILVRKMGGVITVRSTAGKGSSFRITIPQKVVDDTPIVSVKHPESINAVMYVNMEKYRLIQIRDEYENVIRHVIGDLNVKCHVCRNLPELRRRIKNENFSHVFLICSEYIEDKNFFDNLSKNIVVTVFVDQSETSLVDNNRINIILKPFYVIPICEILNGEALTGSVATQVRTRKFIAPDAKILVVDDNKMNLNVIEGLLRQYRIQVTKASSGSEALEKITSMDYDFVFMDHMMPEMDGVETMRRIREKKGNYYRQVPIIALTANAAAGARDYFLSQGFNDFLEKPVELSVLERVLKRNIPVTKQIPADDSLLSEPSVKDIPQTESPANGTPQSESPVNDTPQPEGQITDETGTLDDFLDTKTGISFCGSKEMYYDVLKTCYEECHTNLQKINSFLENENWKEYIILVHALKSTLKTIGAGELSEEMRKLEFAGKEDNTGYIKENHEAAMKEYEELMDRIGSVQEPGIDTKPDVVRCEDELTPVDDEQVNQILQRFEDAVYGFDESEMLGIIESIEGCAYCKIPLDSKLSAAKSKVKKSDYMSAYQYLQEMFENIKKKGAV